ncbi:5964_t:CDS:1, partial [Cetraspora pellucida]
IIKKAYRSLALRYHSDKGFNVEKMKEINEAYNRLCDYFNIKDNKNI